MFRLLKGACLEEVLKESIICDCLSGLYLNNYSGLFVEGINVEAFIGLTVLAPCNYLRKFIVLTLRSLNPEPE